MEEEVKLVKDSVKESMDKAISHLEKMLATIRAGKASPSILDSVTVESYGSIMPLNQVAGIAPMDARTLSITPWDKSVIASIEKGILSANLGLTPMNNGESIIITIPPMTEERRVQLAKQVKSEGEEAKVVVRNARKEGNAELKKLQKEGLSEDHFKLEEDNIQEITNSYVSKIDVILQAKEVEIFKV